MKGEPVLKTFSGFRDVDYDENCDDSEPVLRVVCSAADRLVFNIGWCRVFGTFLPLSIPERRREIARIGARMTAIFYLEKVGKSSGRNPDAPRAVVSVDSTIERIDAYWLRALELSSAETL